MKTTNRPKLSSQHHADACTRSPQASAPPEAERLRAYRHQIALARQAAEENSRPYHQSVSRANTGRPVQEELRRERSSQRRPCSPEPVPSTSQAMGISFQPWFNLRTFALVGTVLFLMLTVIMVADFSVTQHIGFWKSLTLTHKIYWAYISAYWDTAIKCHEMGPECSWF